MAKYLKIPVTGNSAPSITVGVDDIATIERVNDAETKLFYSTGDLADNVLTLTHTAVASTDPYGMRNALVKACTDLVGSSWKETIVDFDLGPIKTSTGATMAVTGIVLD